MVSLYIYVTYFFLNKIIFIDHVKSKKSFYGFVLKLCLREPMYNSLMRMILKPLKIKECSGDNHNQLIENPKTSFKWKIKSFNILSSTKKLLFPIYFYGEVGDNYNMIKGEQCS